MGEMSLIKCPECGKAISEYSSICIGCGCPMETIRLLRDSYTTQGLLRLCCAVYDMECEIKLTARYLPVEYYSALDSILSKLSPREKRFMEMRFGLKEDHIYPLEEILEKLDITYDRGTQIEHNVISKVRTSGLQPLLKVMSEFPTIYELEREAKFRNYSCSEQGAPEFYDQTDLYGLNAFDKLCSLLLKMYKPIPESSLGEGAKKIPIEEVDFTVRTYMYLTRFGIKTLNDLVNLSEDDFKRKVTAKPPILSEVKHKLNQYHLKFAQQA